MRDQLEVIDVPYWLESDTFVDDPVWDELVTAGGGRGRGALYDALKASYCDLKSYCARHMTNGWLIADRALYLCRGKQKLLDLLCSSPLPDRPPLVHAKGDDCPCLPSGWNGYGYYVHGFLKRNPSRSEVERNKAQKADLRDARLKAEVYARDGGCCRYCRSGPLSPKAGRARDRRKVLQYDHVDPDRPAEPGGKGLVVACGACNEYKGHRTPGEAGMTLLDEPTATEVASWAARGPAEFDRSDHRRITDESPTNHCFVGDRNTDRTSDTNSGPDSDPDAVPTGEMDLNPADHLQEQVMRWSGKGAGSGRGAGAVADAPPAPPRKLLEGQPVRGPTEPDIYHGRSRASPGETRYEGWPPGSVPVEPRRSRPEED